MDTKLRSNDNEPYDETLEDELPKKERPPERRSGKVKKMTGAILFLGAIVLISLCYIFFSNMVNYRRLYPYDMVYNGYYGAGSDLVRYAKNINRYFLYYGGARFETEQEVTEADKEEYRAKQLRRMMEEEAQIEEEYRQRIINGYQTELSADYGAQEDYGSAYSVTYSITQSTADASEYEAYVTGTATLSEPGYNTATVQDNPGLKVNDELYKERERALEGLRSKYNISYRQMREEILAEKNQNYADIKNYLSETQETFQYYLYNPAKFTVYSNIPGINTEIKGQTDLEHVNSFVQDYRNSYCYYSISLDDDILKNNMFNGVALADSFMDNGFQGFIAMPLGSNLVYNLRSYTQSADRYHAYTIIALVASFIMLVALLVFCLTTRLKDFVAGNALFYGIYLRQPFLMKIFIVGTISLLVVHDPFYAPEIIRNFSYSFFEGAFITTIVTGAYSLCALYLVLSLEFAIITLKNIKNLKEEPEFRLIRRLKQELGAVLRTRNTALILFYAAILLLTTAGTLIAIATIVYYFYNNDYDIGFFVLLCYCVVFLIPLMAYRLTISYAMLANAIHSMDGGSFEKIAPAKGAFARPLTELAEMGDGLQKSIDEAVKSQRLKSELITNVSHDLKTPLTSIINYVDLLKKCAGFSNDRVALDYIEVLEKKSMRLQVLIEDLFEASKLNSGSAELNLEIVDLVDLLKQTLGEMSEKIEGSSVVFRVRYEKEHIYAYVDGKKIWRVFENLLNNILKYSQPGSRAYLSIEEENDIVELVFKNISAYEINFDADELFERFKRGDDSRSTEGSGLGLSIARSIVELHNGSMEIVVDGDLFKVVVRIAKA